MTASSSERAPSAGEPRPDNRQPDPADHGLWGVSPPSTIEDYAMVGDLHTAALIARDGSVDWMCLPRFDSDASFASLLGGPKAGRWRLAPLSGGTCTERRYSPDTMVLESTWQTPTGTVRVIDFMPIRGARPTLVRIVEGLRGTVEMGVELVARFGHGKVVPWVRHLGARWVAVAGPDSLWLDSPVPMRGRNLRTLASFTVDAGERVPFVLTWAPSYQASPARTDPDLALSATRGFWQDWIAGCTYEGRYGEAVRRSLIVLADALALTGRHDEARTLFERLLTLRNDVGLLSEEWDPTMRHQLGNTPQAFSHVGLVNTALSLDRDTQHAATGGPDPARGRT